MQGIYTYIPETNYVPREYGVAAVLLSLFMVLISLVSVLNLLYFHISTFRSICAVPNVAVFCTVPNVPIFLIRQDDPDEACELCRVGRCTTLHPRRPLRMVPQCRNM
jgi:hypothetical protein